MKTVKTGIIGSGKMGTNLVNYLAECGIELCWIVSPKAEIPKLRKSFGKKIGRLLDNGIISEEQHERFEKTIISSDISCLEGCDLVIEAVTEQESLKRKVLPEADAVMKTDAILVSNSSSFNPSALCPSRAREQNFAGLHFFYPVNLVNIVEIIRAPGTSEVTVDRLISFLDAIHRKYIVLNEKESFILNRIFLDVQNEAYRIVDQKQASCGDIDKAVKGSLFATGIFDFFDHVGLDTMLISIKNYTAIYPDSAYYAPLITKLEELTAKGFFGRKSGRGFYDYADHEPENESAAAGPEQIREIRNHLGFTYKNASRRWITRSGLTIDELNEALKEYFGTEQGPFD